MGYDWIIRVATSNEREWDIDEFVEKYEEIFGKDNILEVKGHGPAGFWDHTPQLEKVSKFFAFVKFRFYYYYFDYENLIIYEYHNGIKIKETTVDKSAIEVSLKELGIREFVWNPKNVLDGGMGEWFGDMTLEWPSD